ncbi:hypothetical protein [Hyalangium gracile]|uniref:hypothetical protein n=1 Tax=Hyalangium gracile TaxID=394092 RepID=UPI001CCF3425|nr:hypothetical protein [Hyalangium gracile]
MKPLMMAALVVQLTSAGGAGSGRPGEKQGNAGSSMKDVGKHFTALKGEVKSLSQQFREAKERARLEAERKKQEEEGFHAPQTQRPAAVPAAPGGSAL